MWETFIKNCCIGVYFDGKQVIRRKRPVMAPGEMEEIRLEKEKASLASGTENHYN